MFEFQYRPSVKKFILRLCLVCITSATEVRQHSGAL